MQTFYLIIIARSLCKLEYKLKQLQTGKVQLLCFATSVTQLLTLAWQHGDFYFVGIKPSKCCFSYFLFHFLEWISYSQIASRWTDCSRWLCTIAMGFSLFCSIVDRRNVFNLLKLEKLLSAVQLVTGRVRWRRSRFMTSGSICAQAWSYLWRHCVNIASLLLCWVSNE